MKDGNMLDTTLIEQEASAALKSGYKNAENLLREEDKLERFLQRLERKLKTIPKIGDKLAAIPALVSMLKSYVSGEYTDLPLGTVVAVISALTYFLSPIDIIPDTIPGVGHLDDAFVIASCMNLVEDDVNEYLKWRAENGYNIIK